MSNPLFQKCIHGVCEKEGTVKLYGGTLMCNDHALNYYRSGDINKACAEFAQKMESAGIKKGSWRWATYNMQFLADMLGKDKLRNDWKDVYIKSGIWGVIRVFIIFYFIVKSNK